MDENRFINLRVLEKTEQMVNEQIDSVVKPGISHPNQSNPIYKNMVKFHHTQIANKFSVRDLFW